MQMDYSFVQKASLHCCRRSSA